MESEMVLKIYARKEVAERLRDAINTFLTVSNVEDAVIRALARNTILNELENIDGLILEEVPDDEN